MLLIILMSRYSEQSNWVTLKRNHICDREVGPLQKRIVLGFNSLETLTEPGRCLGPK